MERDQLKQEDGLRNSMFLANLSGVVNFCIKTGKINDPEFIKYYQELLEYYEYNTPMHKIKGE